MLGEATLSKLYEVIVIKFFNIIIWLDFFLFQKLWIDIGRRALE